MSSLEEETTRQVGDSSLERRYVKGKAYDRVEWNYLHNMLIKLGFLERRVQLIMKYVTIVKLNILQNGKEIGPIIPEARQGDPLSPCLFIIYAEGLSMSLSSLQEKASFMVVR